MSGIKMLEDTCDTGLIWRSEPRGHQLMPLAARLDYLGLLDLWIKDRPRRNVMEAHNGPASNPDCAI